MRLADDERLALLLVVDIVDESSMKEFEFVDFGLVGINTDEGGADIVVAERDGDTTLSDVSSNVVDIVVVFMFCGAEIFVIESDDSSLFQSIVGFGCLPSSHHHRVVEIASRVLHDGVDESVA